MQTAEVSRRLLSLSRQGGISFKDRGKVGPPEKKMGRSNSSPALLNTKTSFKETGGSRLGGGFSRDESAPDLKLYREHLDKVKENRCDLEFCEKPFYRTALWEATWKNHATIVKLLAAKGANVSAPDYQGRTPLHEAAYYGHLKLVGFFIDKGHPIDCVDSFGQTPLFRASEAGRADVVRCLVERGANTNLLDRDKCTAQHVSAFQGRLPMAEYLRFHGAMRNRFAIGEDSELMRKSTSGSLKSGAALVLNQPRKPSRGMLLP